MPGKNETTTVMQQERPDLRRTIVGFGLGAIGRDMAYTMVSMFLMYYLTEVLGLPDSTLAGATLVMSLMRFYDAVNDPVMGSIVDNTRSRWGRFKPWILSGALGYALFTFLFFVPTSLTGPRWLALFTAIYFLWELTFTMNDIGYWSMLPALTTSQRGRERIAAFARIAANIGLFAVVIGILPLTKMLSGSGEAAVGWTRFAGIVVLLLLAFQSITLIVVHEDPAIRQAEERTKLREIGRLLLHNDQLLWTAIAMLLFMAGYMTTTSFGTYFFKYAYGDEGMYPVFALVLGVSQIAALLIFPLLRKRFTRGAMFRLGMLFVGLGYAIFYFAPMSMFVIGPAGVLIFTGQAFIQLLMLVFIADTVEYGQWKLGLRNESVTLAVQPFINKMGSAISSAILGFVLIRSGINRAREVSDVSSAGLRMMKNAMMLLPLLLILASYLIWRLRYRIDADFYQRMLGDLAARGDIREAEGTD